MKYRMLSCFLLAIVLFSMVGGCSDFTIVEKPVAEGEVVVSADTKWRETADWILFPSAASDKGYYYLQEEKILHFLDTTSLKDVVLCSQAGCKHTQSSCDAYVSPLLRKMFFSEGKLYTIEPAYEQAGGNEYQLIRREEDGSNREAVMTFMKDMEDGKHTGNIYNFQIANNCLYFIQEIYDTFKLGSSGNVKGVPELCSLRKVDLANGHETELYSSKDHGFKITGIGLGKILLMESPMKDTTTIGDPDDYDSQEYLSSEKFKVVILDEEKSLKKVILEENRYNAVAPLAAYGEYLYMQKWDSDHKKIGIERINMNTGEKREALAATDIISNYFPLDEETYLIQFDQEKNSLVKLKDFTETPVSFLSEDNGFVYRVANGYILGRALEQEKSENTSIIKKKAYFYLSDENAKAGIEHYVDFYIKK